MNIKKLEYEIINECKCGCEELFVLIGSVDTHSNYELDIFVETLLNLISQEYIICTLNGERIEITKTDIKNYIETKLKNNEDLEEHSEIVEEYCFTTTDKGIKLLREEDKPIIGT